MIVDFTWGRSVNGLFKVSERQVKCVKDLARIHLSSSATIAETIIESSAFLSSFLFPIFFV